MEKIENNLKRMCSFYVSNWHLSTMILPFISKQLDQGCTVVTMLETGIENNIKTILSKINLNDESRGKVEQLNWNSTNFYKYKEVERYMEERVKKDTKTYVLVSGKKEYIEIVNRNIENWVVKNEKRIQKNHMELVIVNCFEVMQFNNHIKEILDKHDKILNTAGEKEIEEVFEGYQRQAEVQEEEKQAN